MLSKYVRIYICPEKHLICSKIAKSEHANMHNTSNTRKYIMNKSITLIKTISTHNNIQEQKNGNINNTAVTQSIMQVVKAWSAHS